MQYAEILFQQKVGEGKETLTYALGDSGAQPGDLVEVSLRNRKKTGLVTEIHSEKPSFKTLPLKEVLQKSLMSEESLKLQKWLSTYYFCSNNKTSKLFIPKRVFENKPIKTRKKKESPISKIPSKTLTKDQKKTVDEIMESKKKTFLIHGITGSGKTEIYTSIAKASIKKGEQVLMLVPEISLTPQLINYFEESLGTKVAVIHSKLSEGERYESWINIWKNEAKIVIGSRSAIFAPFQDLGLIIVDEEHELSYKQDQAPRYNALKVAEKMQELSPKVKIVLGSATPSIESKELLKESTLSLNERIGKSVLPEIELVDLREEFHKKNYSIFSDSLRDALQETLDKKEQAILFLNRRGSASSIVCRDCGLTLDCPDCEIPLTYHARTLKNQSLICHHCGIIKTPPEKCPDCQGINIRYLGIGTQKIETELQKEFPKAKILRADKDTTSTKHGFKDIYEAFKSHKADFLIGTQMIAKGLHLPKVNLVGVILADIGLNIPDYRTAERNFQLMTQVAGRSGRTEKQGKVIIQTYNPESISLVHTKNSDYEGFFQYENTQRKLLKNPPYGKLAKLLIVDPNQEKSKSLTEELENRLWKIVREENLTEEIEINTYPSYLMRLHNKYRQILLIKDISNTNLIHKLLEKLPKEDIMNPNIKIDIDPISIT